MQQLRKLLLSIDTKGYKAYKKITGVYSFEGYTLGIDHVQGDPFAKPSRLSLSLPIKQAKFPIELWESKIRRVALEDYIGRAINLAIRKIAKGQRGSGCSGEISIATSGQQVLQRNAVVIKDNNIEARITLGLPANGRRVASQQAIQMIFDELPEIAEQTLYYKNLPPSELSQHIESVEDQEFLRDWIKQHNLVAFVADGSILPRLSGVNDLPLTENPVPFQAPHSLVKELELPNAGKIKGLGIPPGVCLIVGGGFHGKSTLLHALERGPYNHIPEDGRERVVCLQNTVKIRAEDGRAISKVNIQPFIDRLPFGRDTSTFTTQNASGSTSQAANIIEALHCGSKLLLIDEDTSASNFMIRDERMQALVAADKEPITPLIHRVRDLYERHGISSIIVMGGSGDYFSVADTVIMMDTYNPIDATKTAHDLAKKQPIKLPTESSTMPNFELEATRRPGLSMLDPAWKNREIKIDILDQDLIRYGKQRIDLNSVEQLINIDQTRSIGLMILYYSQHYADSCQSLIEGLERVINDTQNNGLDILSEYKVGNLAMPRLHELAATINRIRNGEWI
jgi:predicted ABC-class ATPase